VVGAGAGLDVAVEWHRIKEITLSHFLWEELPFSFEILFFEACLLPS
jgi:hypothetical protein